MQRGDRRPGFIRRCEDGRAEPCWPAPPLSILGYESNRRADLQPIESAVDDGVAMEVDLLGVIGLDESVVLTRHEARDAPAGFTGMDLHLATHPARGILNLAVCGGEGFSHRDQGVLVFRLVPVGPVDDDVIVARHGDAKVNS
ncbi:hypothetical protein GCM10010862_38400 [Devosia nitrariae]|uniref:Uncharacterized protein n=1 Tax=Devosia nitrariae TaxID=2071872 RepID=A0ABQ5WAB6_9HYPH|nr:hypothetical protein [Devosia nitrariae]GLQ56581.1 hypothetical protein GCM10010862_38400 [Devosia nitrariae]